MQLGGRARVALGPDTSDLRRRRHRNDRPRIRGDRGDHVVHRGVVREFSARVRIDTPAEAAYFQHGGILQYVLRHLLNAEGQRSI